MWRILFHSFWFKLVALVMALLLWFHVATDKTYDHTEAFTLGIINIPESLILAEELPSQVSVTIRGKGKELLKLLMAEKRSINLDAQEFNRGETDHQVKPEQIPIPEGLELRVINILPPRNLKIRLDYPMEKSLRVQPNVKILPAEGFELVGEVHYSPKEVTISGPRMWVRGLTVINTQEKVVEYASSAVSDQVDLILPEGYNLILSTTKVSFSQNIEMTVERRISNLPAQSINIPKPRKAMLEPDSISLIISGAESVVREIDPAEIKVTVDCSGVKRQETAKRPVLVRLPDRVNLKKTEPDSVRVLIE
jgi:YbbR domain-containing protein